MKTAAEVARAFKVPGSPWSIQCQINQALTDACSPINRFAEIIQSDASLASRVVTLANSPIYPHAGEIGTIPDAIMLLGLQKIRDLVSVILVLEFFDGIESEIVSMESFMRHSLGVGVASRLLAIVRRDSREEQHFLSGLIHDIGRLALLQICPERMGALIQEYRERERTIPLHLLEKQHFHFDHAQVGAELLQLWRFPDAVSTAIRFHHEPWRAGHFETASSLLHAADVLSLSLAQGTTGETLPPTLQMQAWERLRLPEGTMEQLIPELDRQYKELAEIFAASAQAASA